MRIALLGYGKMGKTIEKVAESKGHKVVLKLDKDSRLKEENINKVDVAIEFSTPQSAFDNLKCCFEKKIPVVCGTTGWLDDYFEATQICKKYESAFIYASNFSLGVNLFFLLNKYLTKMMSSFKEYNLSIEELHHIHKKDAPSGTAITLAEGIIKNSNKTNWQLDGKSSETVIPITSKRLDNLHGTHIIRYDSQVDDIEIKHTAHNRDGFALGAIIAAEWLVGKKGIFSMRDVLNLR